MSQSSQYCCCGHSSLLISPQHLPSSLFGALYSLPIFHILFFIFFGSPQLTSLFLSSTPQYLAQSRPPSVSKGTSLRLGQQRWTYCNVSHLVFILFNHKYYYFFLSLSPNYPSATWVGAMSSPCWRVHFWGLSRKSVPTASLSPCSHWTLLAYVHWQPSWPLFRIIMWG